MRVPEVSGMSASHQLSYFTVTLTCSVDQQHWNPPPPAPVESLLSSRRMYSPGALNVALLVAFPSFPSIFGLAASTFPPPGPRIFAPVIAGRGGVGISAAAPAAPAAPRPAAPRPRPRPCAASP